MNLRSILRLGMCALALGIGQAALAAGGPLGIDRKVTYDDSGIWNRSTQKAVLGAAVLANLGTALWDGGETRAGKTSWQTVDAMLFSELTAVGLKAATARPRPRQIDDPDLWFQGSGYRSFPSEEVTVAAAAVTPWIAEYHGDHPWIWGLELLPAYDAMARVKVNAHWQTDVLAGWIVGSAWGYWAHNRKSPVILNVLPDGFMVGFKKKF